MEFADRVFIVTGGGGVVGRGITRRLHEEGARVVIAGRKAEKLDAAYRDIGVPEDRQLAISGDVADEQFNIDLINRTVERFGRLDGIVPCVFWSKTGSSQEITLEEWNQCLAVTLTSTFLAAKYGVPAIRETAGRGSITAISSVFGEKPGRNYAMYSVAKAGLNMLVRALAYDHTHEGVRVNCVSPGATQDDPPHFNPLEEIGTYGLYLIGRYLSPEDIGNAVVFLASDRADGITGQILSVDGGSTIPEQNPLMWDTLRKVKAKYGE